MSMQEDPLHIDSSQSFPFPPMDALYDTENGFLSLSSQSAPQSQQPGSVADFAGPSQVERVAVRSLLNLPLPRPVEGKRGLLLSVYTASNIMSAASYRSRVGALKFPDTDDRFEFMHGLLGRIGLAKARLHQDFGFAVRSCTYVVEEGFMWVVLIGMAAMSFAKWHKVYVRLGAQEIKTVCIQRATASGTQSSLETVADMFGGLTNLEELVRHEIICQQEEGQSKERPSKKRKTPVTERTKAASPARGSKAVRAVRFDDEPSQAPSAAPACNDIVAACLAFLTSKDMPAVQAQHAMLLEHVVTNSQDTFVGAYLLSAAPLQLFARVVHLRALVVRVLADGFGIDGRASLCTTAIVGALGFESVPPDSQAILQLLGQCVDQERNFPVFFLVDMGVILTLGSLYMAEQSLAECKTRDRRLVLKESVFLDGYQNVVCEQVWWLVTIGCRMSRFLALQAGTRVALSPFEEGVLFPHADDEQLSLHESLQGFPALQHLVERRAQEGFCLKSRYKFYNGKPSMSLARVRQAFKIAVFGKAVELFQLVQQHSRSFYEMLPDDPAFRALPATQYSTDPASHVGGLGDTENLVRQLLAGRRG